MELNIFDVVELNDGNKATILKREGTIYKVEITNSKGISQGVKVIKITDINKVIFSK